MPHYPKLEQTTPEMTAKAAIAALREIRPGSVETEEQEAFVSTWESTIWKRQSVYASLAEDVPPFPLEIEGDPSQESNLFMLTGLPGSGKS